MLKRLGLRHQGVDCLYSLGQFCLTEQCCYFGLRDSSGCGDDVSWVEICDGVLVLSFGGSEGGCGGVDFILCCGEAVGCCL